MLANNTSPEFEVSAEFRSDDGSSPDAPIPYTPAPIIIFGEGEFVEITGSIRANTHFVRRDSGERERVDIRVYLGDATGGLIVTMQPLDVRGSTCVAWRAALERISAGVTIPWGVRVRESEPGGSIAVEIDAPYDTPLRVTRVRYRVRNEAVAREVVRG